MINLNNLNIIEKSKFIKKTENVIKFIQLKLY